MPSLKTIKRSLVYLLTRFLVFFFNIVPRRVALFLASWLALAAWKLLPRERYRVFRHLSAVYKDTLTPSEKNLIGRNFFVNSGKNLADVFRFRKHFHSEIKHLVTVEGLEYFEQAYQNGKGILGITGHIGNFELLAAYIADRGYEIAVIGREMYDPRLDKLLVENREAMGLVNFATTDSPKKIFSWLKEGKALGVLIDNDSFRVRGMFIPAFGRLSNTPVGQTIIGLRAGAAFLPMACLRTRDNRYKVIIYPPVEYAHGDTSDNCIYQVTLKCTKALEEIIDSHKDQWSWIHNRWRTKP